MLARAQRAGCPASEASLCLHPLQPPSLLSSLSSPTPSDVQALDQGKRKERGEGEGRGGGGAQEGGSLLRSSLLTVRNDQNSPLATGHGANAREDLLRARAREDVARHTGCQQAGAHEADCAGLMATAAAAEQGDLGGVGVRAVDDLECQRCPFDCGCHYCGASERASERASGDDDCSNCPPRLSCSATAGDAVLGKPDQLG